MLLLCSVAQMGLTDGGGTGLGGVWVLRAPTGSEGEWCFLPECPGEIVRQVGVCEFGLGWGNKGE